MFDFFDFFLSFSPYFCDPSLIPLSFFSFYLLYAKSFL